MILDGICNWNQQMVDPPEIYTRNSQKAPELLPRASRPARGLLLAIIVLCMGVVIFWLKLLGPESVQQAISRQAASEVPPPPDEITRPKSFDERLDAALYAERQRKRDYAHQLFQGLLEEAAGFPENDPRLPSILARAASFYGEGKEIPQKEVEYLFLKAIRAIDNVYGQDYYDYQNMYRGLEQLYLSMGRYQEAADQTRRLVDFFQSYETNTDARYAMVLPTLVRLGDNYALAGRVEEARKAYESALEMARAHGSDSFFLTGIEERLNKLNEQTIRGQ